MPGFASGAPPLPPSMQGASAPGAGGGVGPSGQAGMFQAGQQAAQTMQSAQNPGQSQVSQSVVRMGAEIDQALKLLAQAMPALAPWVEKTTQELRIQLGTALQNGQQATNPTPQDSQRFPDGSGRI